MSSIFFDLRKVFDSVPHRPLVDKLANLGLDLMLMLFLGSSANRKQQVVVGGESSPDTPVFSGRCTSEFRILSPLMMFLTSSYQTETHSILTQMTCCCANQ